MSSWSELKIILGISRYNQLWPPGSPEQGWAGILVSRDSQEYKPQISLPASGILQFPFPFLGKGSFGREILLLFAVLRMAGKGMNKNKILNLTLLFIWFPGLRGSNFPSLPVAFYLLVKREFYFQFPFPFPGDKKPFPLIPAPEW